MSDIGHDLSIHCLKIPRSVDRVLVERTTHGAKLQSFRGRQAPRRDSPKAPARRRPEDRCERRDCRARTTAAPQHRSRTPRTVDRKTRRPLNTIGARNPPPRMITSAGNKNGGVARSGGAKPSGAATATTVRIVRRMPDSDSFVGFTRRDRSERTRAPFREIAACRSP